MSMPEIIRQYLRTFELRQDLEAMRSLSWLRKLPRWFPLRQTLLRKKTRKLAARADPGSYADSGFASVQRAEVVYLSETIPAEVQPHKTGTDGI
jgi:hypothetical protein